MFQRWLFLTLPIIVGCAGRPVCLPSGYLPPPLTPLDTQTSTVLAGPTPAISPPKAPPDSNTNRFDLPPRLPGANAEPLKPLLFAPDTSAAERQKATVAAYPELVPVSAPVVPAGAPVSLAELQSLALENSPVIRKAKAEADAVYGQVIQVGLYPNPTIGYQVDQWQPGSRPKPINNNGQQGGYITQLIKTADKLPLAQFVAGYDYVNALVAVRKAEVQVTAAVRTQYFAAIVAQQSVDVNKALAKLADDVYQMQLKQVAAGEAAGYEPLQLYAQAVQARNAVIQSEAAFRSAWKQLAAAVGQPDLPLAPLAGRAEAAAPTFKRQGLEMRIVEQHTDLLTARNSIAQAQKNLIYQKRIPIPDLQLNNAHQYDNVSRNYQFNLQLGVTLPISDRNQGNIRTACARIAVANQQLLATQNDLSGRLEDAFIRYEANAQIAANFRDRIVPRLSQGYRAIVQRWNADDPGKVSFNDIVAAQQNYAQALQSYLAALSGQWQAVVDLATIAQLDDLYFDENTRK